MSRYLRHEYGYSMVEVLVAILILSVAIIPMVTMFDTALRSAETSSDYDRARTFANQKLEQAKNAAYDDLADRFPKTDGTLLATPESGAEITSDIYDANAAYPGVTYRVTKQFVDLPVSGDEINASDDGDEGMIKVTVTSYWNDGNSFTVNTVVSR